MRLSDAIMAGSLVLQPRGGAVFKHDVAGCALGMALKAVVPAAELVDLGEMGNRVHFARCFPWTQDMRTDSPCGCADACRVSAAPPTGVGIIMHIFDYHVMDRHDWTLERLIDWVRSVEPKEEHEPVTKNVDCDVRVEVGAGTAAS